jgi:hypothetical protein
MKKLLLAAAALAAFPAQAGVLLPGGTANFDPFSGDRGTRIAYSETTDTVATFSATFRAAVYKTSGGTLDFYFQVARLGAGTIGDDEIVRFTVANFQNWTVNAERDGSDFDGAGGFTAANNPGPGGFTSLAERNVAGSVLEANFHGTGLNGLVGTENSTTYIFRTNAYNFQRGSFGVLDGSAMTGFAFAPQVPEPATWAMMIGGFGLLGAAARRSRRSATVLA